MVLAAKAERCLNSIIVTATVTLNRVNFPATSMAVSSGNKRDRFLQGLKAGNLSAKDNPGPEVQQLLSADTKKLSLFGNSFHLLT